jgi:DNA recombination protein RmuC
MSPVLYLAVGFIIGAAVGAFILLLTRRDRSEESEMVKRLELLDRAQEREERMFREEMGRSREEGAKIAKTQREELCASLEGLRSIVDLRLKQLQEDNAKQIDRMRATVDEKLQGTLEKRLGESFTQVSQRLEQVHKGLGEMQTLAMGVGDLKRVLSNVTTRGNWGEIQLENLLDQILTHDQYERRVKIDEASGEAVDFAIKLPGKGNGESQVVWLPIDAKFPTEDYQRLVEAQEKADAVAADAAAKMLANRLRDSAKEICAKYIRPPRTTDFGIMFLPTEGLYAEMVRRTGLFEVIQRECRVMIAGPTTLAALLNSLQMGFRSLTIQKRSSEVWQLLAKVKTEFGKFGDLLDGVKRKLDQASNTMEDAARKSRTIERKLRNVEELPPAEANVLLRDLIPEEDPEE